MVLTPKALAFTVVKPAKILTATMLNSTSTTWGCLLFEVTYDKMEALLSQNIHPVDILLMMAASEGDKPKIEEVLRAGASYTVKDADGKTALDKVVNEEIKDFMLGFSVQKL